MSDESTSTAEARAELVARQAAAEERVHDLEREWREAGLAREQARRALVEAERNGVSAAQRTKLERALTDAEARVAERWPERIAGAHAAVGDAQVALRDFSAAHLDDLLEGLFAKGEVAAEAENQAAEAVRDCHRRVTEIAHEISATIHSAGIRVTPDLVTRSRSDALAREAERLLQQGGEVGPRLRRDPRIPTKGMPDDEEESAA